MTIYETIGMAWVIFTVAIGSVEILYLAWIGLQTKLGKYDKPLVVDTMGRPARIPGVIEP